MHRYPTDLSEQFGSQKRRLVESFEGLNLLLDSSAHHQHLHQQVKLKGGGGVSPPVSKRQLIQVLKSVEFVEDSNSHGANPES